MESPTGTYDLSFSDASISDLGSHVASPVIVPPSRNSEDSAPMFEAGDGDMYISVNGARFETHKYLIKRFRGLKQLLEQQPAEVSIQCNNLSENDFGEVFKLLYATIFAGPLTFSSHTLVSALRVATVYDYPALRIYCVQCLEALELDAVKRIDIAKEFDLPAWEEPAYHELKMRDNPITREEAEIIGLDALVRIAEMREKEQRRRGKDVDAMHMGNKHDPRAPPKNPNLSEDISLSADTKDKNPSGDRPGGDLSGAPPPQLQLQPLPCFQAEVGATTSMDNSGPSPTRPQQSINIDKWKSTGEYIVKAPDCKRRFTHNGVPLDREPSISPCNASASNSIQAQQSASAKRFSSPELPLSESSAPTTTKRPFVPRQLLLPSTSF